MRQAISAKSNLLTEDERRVIGPVLQIFDHVSFEEGVSGFGSKKLVSHRIERGDAASIRKAPCRAPFALRQEI